MQTPPEHTDSRETANALTAICEVCLEPLPAARSDRRSRYCSAACYLSTIDNGPHRSLTMRLAAHRSLTMRLAAQHGRPLMPARKANGQRRAIPKWLRNMVYDRDQGICKICGLPVDMSMPWGTGKPRGHAPAWDQGPSIDHRLPVSAGGQNNIDNLQLAHRICNYRKGTDL